MDGLTIKGGGIYYSTKNICEDLNCGTQKACKLLNELEKVGALATKQSPIY